jgi:hypothetical protein
MDYVNQKLASKPSSIHDNNFINNLYKKIGEDPNPREKVRSVQIADPHLDLSYEAGLPTECGYPICCRNNGPD